MPRNQQTGAAPPLKRVKLNNNAQARFAFTSADEIRRCLRTREQDSLIEGIIVFFFEYSFLSIPIFLFIALTALRNQLTVKPGDVISLQDERLLLAQHWLELSPGVQDLFDVWEASNQVRCFTSFFHLCLFFFWMIPLTRQRQISLSSLFISIVACLLLLSSSHYTCHSLGQPIMTTLLSPQWMRRLNSNLTGSHNGLILVTLRLLNIMSAFAGGRERKSVLEAFSWETQVCFTATLISYRTLDLKVFSSVSPSCFSWGAEIKIVYMTTFSLAQVIYNYSPFLLVVFGSWTLTFYRYPNFLSTIHSVFRRSRSIGSS